MHRLHALALCLALIAFADTSPRIPSRTGYLVRPVPNMVPGFKCVQLWPGYARCLKPGSSERYVGSSCAIHCYTIRALDPRGEQ